MAAAPTPTLIDMVRPQNSAEIVADNLRRLMRYHGLSQAEFGRRAGVAQTLLSALLSREAGPKNPTLGTLDKLAAELKILPWQLLIPNMAIDLLSGAEVGNVIEAFVLAPPEGRRAILRIAEVEARYAATDTASTGRTQ